MPAREKHNNMLIDNRLKRIENRLRRMEILFLKNLKTGKKLDDEIKTLEKEEKVIESEQKKLEGEEQRILDEMKWMEEEEEWHLKMQYNCHFKIMDEKTNELMCQKINKLCRLKFCPLWKKKK